MDAESLRDPIDNGSAVLTEWRAEFDRHVAAVEVAAREWGARMDQPEGQFISALLGAIRVSAGLSETAHAALEGFGQNHRAAAETELKFAREITTAANIALSQARNALVNYQVERENLTVRMIHETLPQFIKVLEGRLVLREQRWNEGVRRRRLAVAGMVTLALFLGGYGLRSWQQSSRNALGACLAHPLALNGHTYCDITDFGLVAR